MKIAGLLIIVFLCANNVVFSQTPSIRYLEGDWEKILERAASERKLIFVNCHTRWCENCVKMEQRVLNRDSVSEYFNAHFINLTVDMEKPFGEELGKRYGVQAFPAFLFINARGEMVHQLLGFFPGEVFLAEAVRANDMKRNLAAMIKRYKTGKVDMAFLRDYLMLLKMSGMITDLDQVSFDYLRSTGLMQKYQAGDRDPVFLKQYMQELLFTGWDYEVRNVVPVYLGSLSDEELCLPENWKIFTYYTDGDWDETMKRVCADMVPFYEVAGGKDGVENKVMNALRKETGRLTNPYVEGFDEEQCRQFRDELKQIDLPVVPECIANLLAFERVREKDYGGLMNVLDEVVKYNLFRGNTEDYFVLKYLNLLTGCDDREGWEKGVVWADRRVELCDDENLKASYLDIKAGLLDKMGESIQATETREKAKRYKNER